MGIGRQTMTKKNQYNQDFQKTYDGPNQSARNLTTLSGKQYSHPNMRMETHREIFKSMLFHMNERHGESKPVVFLTDSLRVIEALAVLFEDTPIVEVADTLYDMAYDIHRKRNKNEEN